MRPSANKPRTPAAPVKHTRWWHRILAALPFAALLGVVVYYIMGASRGFFHSDCTDTLYWAETIVDSGRVLNPDFWYAAILPFGPNLWLVPLIKIFGVTMLTQTLGMAIFAAIFMLAADFLFKSLQWSYMWRLLGCGALLFILSSSDKLREIMWGHVIYYSLDLTLIFLGLGLIIRLLRRNIFLAETAAENTRPRRDKGLKALMLTLLLALSAGAATDGLQMIALFLAPLAGALIFEQYCDPDAQPRKPLTQQSLILAFFMLSATFAGIGLLALMSRGGSITAGYANAYSLFSASSSWLDNLDRFLPQLFTLLGIDVPNSTSFASLVAVQNLARLFGTIALLIMPLLLLISFKSIKDRGTRLLLWTHLLSSAVVMYGFVLGKLSSANWRLTPILGTSIVVSVAAMRHFFTNAREPAALIVRRRLAAIAVFFIILQSIVSLVALAAFPFNYIKDQNMEMLKNLLIKENLTYGYATFWHAQALTVMTDSKSRVRVINIPAEGVEICDYQSNKNWYEDQPDQKEYFLLLNPSEYSTLIASEDWVKLEPAIQREISESGFRILVFEENIWGIVGK